MRTLLIAVIALLLVACTVPDDGLNPALGAVIGEDGRLTLIGAGTFDTTGGVWIGRFDRDGDSRWQTMVGSGLPERANDVHVDRYGRVLVGGNLVEPDACPDTTVRRGFLFELSANGRLSSARQVRRSADEECDGRSLSVRRVDHSGEFGVALASREGDETKGVTVFTFDDDSVVSARTFDGELELLSLVGHREGFVVAGRLPSGTNEPPGAVVTGFSERGSPLWQRQVEAATDASVSLLASHVVDGELIIAMQELTEGRSGAILQRYDLSDGTLLWSAELSGTGVPKAIVDGPRRRWALVRASAWDFEVVTFLRDTPQSSVQFTAEGVAQLDYRFPELETGEIVDKGRDNAVRWWNVSEGASCDRPSGFGRPPTVSAIESRLQTTQPTWSESALELLDWDVRSRSILADVDLRRCLESSP